MECVFDFAEKQRPPRQGPARGDATPFQKARAMTQAVTQVKTKIAAPSSEKVAQARLLYDSGLTSLSEIRALLGMSAHRFHAYRVQNGWPLRPKLCQPADDETKTAPANAPVHTPRNDTNVRPISPERLRDAQMMILRLEDAVAREFTRAETALARQSLKNAETSARTLSNLIKTLVELKKMPPPSAVPGGPGWRSFSNCFELAHYTAIAPSSEARQNSRAYVYSRHVQA